MYKVKVAQNLYVISMDTLYFNAKDQYDDTSIELKQLKWLEEQLLLSEPNDKFILIAHIYESANLVDAINYPNWTENSRLTWYY